jgi:hypothetical protein
MTFARHINWPTATAGILIFDEHICQSWMGDLHTHDPRSKQNNNNDSVWFGHVDFPNRGNDPDGENDISDHVEYRHRVL